MAAFDDDDLSLSISSSTTRRTSRDERYNADSQPPPVAAGPSARTPNALPTTMKRRLGQYEIIKTLGEGSFGKVKLATHKVSGQKVALKIIARGKLVTRDMAGRIEREIQYLQLLRHPHIIKLYTVITTPKEIVMVLEFAGGELFDYIVNHGRLQEDKARKFFQQIVCAIEYCHRHKIVHRDLKPENLLLDDTFNVKIADFGLSNIMTDGNFLKTSCGSPNYAAPEVISGKLYAGPEVDVWSCGVILYVLLTGRLPFDDEYIPALFKKIQQGTYNMPNYVSPGAARLIRKMLQVNPVSRITIQEIRQDPWFTKDLADYLQPSVEEFLDTGVDPNKAIDPQKLAPSKPAVVQEQLHDHVVGKLGKTMGYAKDDVQEALAKDEPSAIKDAYLIVRENTIMKGNREFPSPWLKPLTPLTSPQASLTQNPSLQPFLAQSPPTHGTPRVETPVSRLPQSPLAASSNVDHPRHGSTGSANIAEARSPVSTIAVLPSSLPSYHLAYMQGNAMKPQSPTTQGPDAVTSEEQHGEAPGPPTTQTSEQKAATARRLNPHARGSQVNVSRNEKPEGMTPLPAKEAKKGRGTKWQFGIRSRNSPSEAMLAIFKALKSMGAVWEDPKIRRPGGGDSEGSPSREDADRERERRRRAREGSQSPEYSDSDPDAGTDPEYASRDERARRSARRGGDSSGDEGGDSSRRKSRRKHRGREKFGAWNDWGYGLPDDPWIINARFRKDGMFPPGVAHPSSNHSSRVDLTESAALRRRSSTMGSQSSLGQGSTSVTPPSISAHGSMENVAASGPAQGSLRRRYPHNDESCWVYVTIQLYCIERDSFMVDFKCAGYERLTRKLRKEVSRQLTDEGAAVGPHNDDDEDDDMDEGYMGLGRYVEEKDITSPFPFMDVASSLIVCLAQRD